MAVVCGLAAATLSVHGEFSRLLPPSAKAVRDLRQLERRTRVLSDYMIGVECDDPEQRRAAAAALLQRLRNMAPGLVAGITADHRAQSQFFWDHRYLFASLSDLRTARDALADQFERASPWFLHLDNDTSAIEGNTNVLERLESRVAQAEAAVKEPAELISKDGHLQLIIVRTAFTSDDLDRGSQLTSLLERAIAATRQKHPSVEIGMAGDIINSNAEHAALRRGVILSTVSTVLIVLIGLWFFYRSVAAIGALGWALCVGVLATLAFARVTIGHLNLASAFLSSIVIGNGINFGLVLLARYVDELRSGPASEQTIVAAAVATAPGTLTAMAAATAAYGSLGLTAFRGFRDFGIIGAVGMLFCWITAYTVLPAGLAWLGPRVSSHDGSRLADLVTRIVAARSPRRALAGVCAFALTSSVAAYYVTHDPFEDDLRNLRSKTPSLGDASRWMKKFDHAFGNGLSGGFAIGVSHPSEAIEVAAKLRAVDRGKSPREQLFSRISVLEDLLPEHQQEKLTILGEIRRMLDSKSLHYLGDTERQRLLKLRPADTLRAITLSDIPPELAWPYTERDGTRGRLVLVNTGLAVDTWRLRSLQQFARRVRQLGLAPDVVIGGSAFVFSDMLSMMRTSGPWATLGSLVGAASVVLILLGWRRFAWVTLGSAALGVTSLLSVACLLRIKVNFLDFVALPITIGVGIDYAANLAARARQLSGSRAGQRAARSTGPVVMLCSYTTIVGYASLLFSLNQGIRSFGLSAMIGEVTCLAAALAFAPAFLEWRAHVRYRNDLCSACSRNEYG